MKIDVPYLKWRDGRPRWEPGPKLRAAGFKGRDLKDSGGGWLDERGAVEAARELNRGVTAWREEGAPRRRTPTGPRRHPQCLAALWDLYAKSPKFAGLAPKTRADYRVKAGVMLADLGDEAVRALSKAHVYGYWEQMHRARGHAMANGILAVLRLVLSYGEMKGWLPMNSNPALKLNIEGVAPRCVVWTPDEVAALVTAADALALPGVADAVVIALHTGQRQGDVLALELGATENARTVFRQSKTGARVIVPHTPALAERLAAIRARRASLLAPLVAHTATGATVINMAHARRAVLRGDGRPYTASAFGKDWRRVREAVAATHPEAAGKLFLDLRDTAVTRLALAGCTVAEIRAITGHSMQTIHAVLAHYLALDERMAGAGIDRLRAWMDEEGIAV